MQNISAKRNRLLHPETLITYRLMMLSDYLKVFYVT